MVKALEMYEPKKALSLGQVLAAAIEAQGTTLGK